MPAPGAEIVGLGLVSPVGLSAALTEAAVRAEVNRFKGSSILNRRFDPMVLSLIASADLPPLAPALEAIPALTTRKARMLRLGGMALKQCLEGSHPGAPIPLLVGAPEPFPVDDEGTPQRPAPAGPLFAGQLGQQVGVAVDAGQSRVFAQGRAAGLAALKEALDRLASGNVLSLVVGGVDSYLDLYLLGTLDLEDRVLAEGVMDGFVPGEGAAFLWLTRPGGAARLGRDVIARIDGAFTAEEPGHRYSKKAPYRGDGLDAAFRGVFAAAPGPPVKTVYAGFTGENFNAKEWGVAYMRHKKQFADDDHLAIEHPVDCFGDAGAALGPMMVVLSALGLKKGVRQGRCLVWCPSDLALRGAALVSTR